MAEQKSMYYLPVLVSAWAPPKIFSEGYRRYLALCLTLLVSQLVRFCFLASHTA